MEKMDQTRTDCNLTRMGFPAETSSFAGEIYPFLRGFFWMSSLPENPSPSFFWNTRLSWPWGTLSAARWWPRETQRWSESVPGH